MLAPDTQWKSYEEVAAYLLNRFAEDFNLVYFEGKQVAPGNSGTEWELDAKGYAEDGTSFVIVECKRHTKSGISQAITGGLAWSIRDTGAIGGILVSPIGLQAGAKKVAQAAGITEVILKSDATPTEYFMTFLNKVCIGVAENILVSKFSESLTIEELDTDGNSIGIHSIGLARSTCK